MTTAGGIVIPDLSGLSPAQLQKTLDELKEHSDDLAKKRAAAELENPFYYYEPSDGNVTEDAMALMREYLKPEDIPLTLQGQKHVHCSTANIVADFGGNQGGKTVVGAVEAYIWVTGEVPPSMQSYYPKEKIPTEWPQHIRVEGVDFGTFKKNLLPAYQEWAPRDYLRNGKWSDSYMAEDRILHLSKKGKYYGSIEYMTNQQDPESHQGPPRHGIIYDEEPKKSIYKENLMRFTTAERIKILFCMTPTKGLTWVYDDIYCKEADDKGNTIETFMIPSITNRKANLKVLRTILDEILSTGGYDEVKMRLLGEFVSLSGLVYGKLFDRNIHVIPPFFEKLPTVRPKGYEGPLKSDFLVLHGHDPHDTTATRMVFVLVDRGNNIYVDRCHITLGDTDDIKADFQSIAKDSGYRLGWGVCDMSADSSIIALGGKNIYKLLKRDKNAIVGLRKSIKAEGSIKAGVNEIKKALKINEITKKPRLFIMDRPENRELITAFRTMERQMFPDEETQGERDKIKEGRHHAHACLRYIFQYPMIWYPADIVVPQPEFTDPGALW